MSFWSEWQQKIAQADPSWWVGCNGDVFCYLLNKAEHIANTKSGIACWEWRARRGPFMRCAVQTEDSSPGSMGQAITSNEATYAPYWPCIVIETGEDTLLFMCPALAWANGRPWRVHRSRLHFYGTQEPRERCKALLEPPGALKLWQGTPRTLDEFALHNPEPLATIIDPKGHEGWPENVEAGARWRPGHLAKREQDSIDENSGRLRAAQSGVGDHVHVSSEASQARLDEFALHNPKLDELD